jgi:hypothetical protein
VSRELSWVQIHAGVGVGVGWGCRVNREPSMPPIHKANAPRGYAPMPVFFHGGINALLF